MSGCKHPKLTLTPADLWQAPDEAFLWARETRGVDPFLADLFAGLSDMAADEACAMERELGIERETH